MISISPDPSCRYLLAWLVEMQGADPQALIIAMRRSERWTDRSRMDVLTQLEHTDGHEVLYVPATGRVQLRLHYLCDRAERAAVASDMKQEFAELLQR